eukprot:TRINITY_DN23124_c0_g1_i1.p1 TRINITY_DN23124_c0_g1~~TRINITY_DN23124_c0_g1_i1.p1  ORF type:complete len:477 (-),score=130.08 TRINITY_DN23124_c0_g1_i1:26-1456(-)
MEGDGAQVSPPTYLDIEGCVRMGQCSWTDPSLVQCKKFFPATAKTAVERLQFYASRFPCVEVDMSNYSIPTPFRVTQWVEATPKKFVFHFKAYQMFTARSCDGGMLPGHIRAALYPQQPAGAEDDNEEAGPPPENRHRGEKVTWKSLSEPLQQELWDTYNRALAPAYDAGKLGLVLFQYFADLRPTDESREWILECRKRLRPEYKMAVELRNPHWVEPAELQRTLAWLRQHNLCFVAIDEFSTYPVVPALTVPDCMYIRVHRREGKDRLLSDAELARWAERLRSIEIPPSMAGSVADKAVAIHFLWNTNYENQSVVNSQKLSKLLGNGVYDWKSQLGKAPGSVMSMFANAAAKKPPAPPAPVVPVKREAPKHTAVAPAPADSEEATSEPPIVNSQVPPPLEESVDEVSIVAPPAVKDEPIDLDDDVVPLSPEKVKAPNKRPASTPTKSSPAKKKAATAPGPAQPGIKSFFSGTKKS